MNCNLICSLIAVHTLHTFKMDDIQLFCFLIGETIPAISMFYVYISRAASSVGVMYRVSAPNTGSNPGGGQILNIKKNFF